MMRLLTVSLLALFLTFSLGAESLWGNYRGEINPEASGTSFSFDELLQINLPNATRFTKALEIEIQVPRELIPYRSDFALFLYQDFVPQRNGPSSGDRIAFEAFSSASKFYIQIPLISNAGLRASMDTAVIKSGVPDFPLGLMIQSISRGLPAELQRSQFVIKTRFLNTNLGALSIMTPNLTAEKKKDLRIVVDGKSQTSENLILLEPGVYQVDVSLPGYKVFKINALINQNKVTEIMPQLEEDPPMILFEAPEATQILLDGKKITWSSLTPQPVEKGLHTIQFILGNYQFTDNFEVTHGGPHKVSLSFQLNYHED